MHSLNLSSNNICSSTVEDLSKLCCILKIENLFLDNNELSDSGIKRLVDILNAENHKLQYVSLTDNNTHYMTEYEFNRLCTTICTVEINPKTKQLYKSLPLFIEDMDTTDNLYCIECTFSIETLADILSLNLSRLHLFGTLHTTTAEVTSLPASTCIRAKEIIIALKNCDDKLAFEIFRKTDFPVVIISEFSIQAKNLMEAELINIALQQCQKHGLKKVLFNSCNVTKCFEELASQLNTVCDNTLEDFQMQNCFLNDNILKAFIKSLNLIRITSNFVDLSHNQITTESAEIIGTIVKDWQIKKLCLNNNQISKEGVNCILNACVLTYHLQDITFEGNKHLQQTEKVIESAVGNFLSLDSRIYFHNSHNNCIIMVVCRLVNFYFLRILVNNSEKIIFEGEQSSLGMANIRIYVNARNLASFHYIKGIFKTVPNFYYHLEEFFVLYDGTLSQFYDEPIATNSALNIKLIFSKEMSLEDMTMVNYPSLKIRINSSNIIPKLSNFCVTSGITKLCIVLHVTQQLYVNNAIQYLLNDVNKIAGLREFIFSSISSDYVTVVSKMISSNPYLESLTVAGNDLDDRRFLQVCSELNHITSLGYLNLSCNRITSCSMPILMKLLASCPIEELMLEGNQVDINGAKMMMENVKAWDHVNFINISNNDIFDADDFCQMYFFEYKFQFSFILTENGIIIARGFPTRQDNDWNYESIQLCSLYIGHEEIIDDMESQNFFDSIEELDELSRVYIVLFQNQSDLSISNIIPVLELAQDIYLCIPSLNIPVLEVISQHHEHKSSLILTGESLYAANCEDAEKLASIIDHSKDSIKTLEFYNCKLSFSLLHKLTLLLSKHDNDKEWECMSFCDCNLSDEHLSYFVQRCNEYRKGQTTVVHCVNLSNNTLSSTAVDELVSFLDMWKSEELYISDNNLECSGFERLVHSRTSGGICLTVLDMEYNNIDYAGAEKLCEEIFLNPETTFCQVILKEEYYNCMVFKHTTTSCASPSMDNYTSPDTNSSTNSRSCLFIQSNDEYEIIHQLNKTTKLSKLCLITEMGDQSKVFTCLKHQRYLTELYLYAKNGLSDQLITQQLTSSCQIKLVVSSEKIEANKVPSLPAITEAVSLLPSCIALNTIKINHCTINKECLELLNTFLCTSPQPRSLKCLDISYCSLKQNISHLLKVPSKSMLNTSIESVNLSSNKLDFSAMDFIANFVIYLNV